MRKGHFGSLILILSVLQLASEQPDYWSWHLISTDLQKSPGRSDPDFRIKIAKPKVRLIMIENKSEADFPTRSN